VGSGALVMKKAIEKHRNDPLKQIAYFCEHVPMNSVIGRLREVSAKTRTDFGNVLCKSVVELNKHNHPIQNISDLSVKNCLRLVEIWAEEGQCQGYIQTKVSHFRKFLRMIGKPNAIPKSDKFHELMEKKGVTKEQLTRSNVLKESKTWTSQGIDPIKLIQEVQKYNSTVGVQMKMMLYFGLRVRESVRLQPYGSDVGDNSLFVYRGTKGGNGRTVPFSTDPEFRELQISALEEAKSIARKHPKRVLADPGLTIEQCIDLVYNTGRRFGIGKNALGVTCHGLRHEFAGRHHEEVSGLRPPVEGRMSLRNLKNHKEELKQAQYEVSRVLGHTRPHIATAYCGSTTGRTRDARNEIQQNMDAIQNNKHVLSCMKELGVSQLWIVGQASEGIKLLPDEAIQLRLTFNDSLVPDYKCVVSNLRTINSMLGSIQPQKFEAHLFLESGSPSDGLEIFLA